MKKYSLLLVLGIIVAMTGCSQMRAVNLAPQTRSTDVYVGDQLVQANLQYKDVSCYKCVCPGCKPIAFASNGSKTTKEGCKLDFPCGSKVTVVATNEPGSCNVVRCVAYRDDTKTDCKKAKVRVIHASPDIGAVQPVLVSAGRDAGCPATPTRYPMLGYRDSSVYASITPGSYCLEARSGKAKEADLRISNMKFNAGTNYTIFLTGQKADKSLSAMSLVDAK